MVNQMVAEVHLSEKDWSVEVKFDAGYAIPETRDDASVDAPSQRWLESLSEDQLSTLRYEAITYLQDWVQLSWSGDEELEVQLSFPEWETSPPVFERDFGDDDMAYFRVKYSGAMPAEEGRLIMTGSDGGYPDLVLIIQGRDKGDSLVTVSGGEEAELWENKVVAKVASGESAVKGRVKVVTGWKSFIVYGFEHVLPKGLDHVLFILGLFFASSRWRDLVDQSVSFTLGHTVTFLIVVLTGFSLPGALVEPLIAATIVWIGIENLWSKKVGNSRKALVFGFGLLHGLGFAAVLASYFEGVDRPVLGVLLSNVGIELAHLLVLVIACGLFWWMRGISWYPWVVRIASVLIASCGLFWLSSRLLA